MHDKVKLMRIDLEPEHRLHVLSRASHVARGIVTQVLHVFKAVM